MDQQLITLAKTEHGLVISLTSAGFTYLLQQTTGHGPDGRYEWKFWTFDILTALLSNYQETGGSAKEWLWPDGNMYGDQGWMTNTPIWVTEPEFGDDGALVDFEHAYLLHNYATRDELGEMLQNGYVIFEACPFSAMEPEEELDD